MGATIKMFSQDTVMQRISKSTLKLWRKQDSEQKLGRESRGRKPCPAFETALLSELLYVSSVHASDGKEGPAEVRVKANAMFSYALIQSTAYELQSRPTWQQDKPVRRLKFTNSWVRSFLRRNCFTRRHISTVIKRIPSDEEVKQTMQDIQEVQKQYNIAAEYVVNLDETGIFYGAAPKYIFEAHGARSGEIPDHDEKSRFTVRRCRGRQHTSLLYRYQMQCTFGVQSV